MAMRVMCKASRLALPVPLGSSCEDRTVRGALGQRNALYKNDLDRIGPVLDD